MTFMQLSRTPDMNFHRFYSWEITLSHIQMHIRLSGSYVKSMPANSIPCEISITTRGRLLMRDKQHTPF